MLMNLTTYAFLFDERFSEFYPGDDDEYNFTVLSAVENIIKAKIKSTGFPITILEVLYILGASNWSDFSEEKDILLTGGWDDPDLVCFEVFRNCWYTYGKPKPFVILRNIKKLV